MYKIKKTLTKKSPLFTILAIGAVLMLLAATAYFAFVHNRTGNTAGQLSTKDYSPPTEDEKTSGDAKKQEIADKTENPPTAPSTANVVIVDAKQYNENIEVRAFVSNIFEDGTCTITFTKDDAIITKKSQAFKDAKTTQCTPVSLPRSEFTSPGTWKVTVQYDSSSVSGSKSQDIEIN